MNCVDFLFAESKNLPKDFVAGNAETISYPDLYRSVLLLSGHLQQRLGENRHVLLIGDNSVFFITCYLAIIHSGNVCVPVNPAASSEAIHFIRTQCDAPLACLDAKYGARFQDLPVEKINPDFLAGPEIAGATPAPADRDFDRNRLAELLFTSGSTALPKGVMLSHANLIANTSAIVEYLKLTEADRICAVLPFHYCYGLSLLHTHLKVGASMVLNNTFMMVGTVVDDLLRYQCTGFAGVPSHYQILLRKYKRFKQTEFPHLRYVTQAGGKLPKAFIEDFVTTFPDIDFVVMYGQTEATSRLSYVPPELTMEKIGSIGRGIPGVELKVVNEAGEPVAPGEVGQIVARGGNVMLGYFNDPEQTALAIRDGYLYTGDIATVDEDGYIYVVARQSEFLKVAGERVSPKEIEEAIAHIPGVVDCSVVGVADNVLGEAIKAVVVQEKGGSLTEDAIIDHCNRHLSAAKVPKFVEFSDAIAVSATGKKLHTHMQELAAS